MLTNTLFRSGKISVEYALDLASYLESELDYIPWDTFITAMVYFDRMLASSEVYGDFSVTNLICKNCFIVCSKLT